MATEPRAPHMPRPPLGTDATEGPHGVVDAPPGKDGYQGRPKDEAVVTRYKGEKGNYRVVDESAARSSADYEAAQAAKADRVLTAAAGEIVSETGRSDFTGWELELVAQVNLARAEELWKQMKAPWGVVLVGGVEAGPTMIARDTFARHAQQLAPLKQSWGIA